jgi:hypothetical protein
MKILYEIFTVGFLLDLEFRVVSANSFSNSATRLAKILINDTKQFSPFLMVY